MIHLAYLPVNAAFAFVLGLDVRTASVFRIDGEALFFSTRDDAAAALARHGLALDGNKVVTG